MNPAQMMARMNRMEAMMMKMEAMMMKMARRNGGLGDITQDDGERRDFYIYEAQALLLVSGANATDTIQIEADSDFILQKLAYFADIAAATQTDASRVVPAVSLLLQDTGSGRQLMQNPIPIPSFFGTGQLPFVLPNPRLFMKNTTIQVTFNNFAVAGTTYSVRLAFMGYKVYGS